RRNKYVSSDKRYNCPKCHRCYRRHSNMMQHFRYECGTEPRFRCPYCPKRHDDSSYDDNLFNMMETNMETGFDKLMHTGDIYWRPGRMAYHCPRCDSGYTYIKTFKAHLKYDCGKAPRFKCPYCNKKDKCSSNIYKHVRMKHDGLPVIVHRT
ncbi:hypothetical protein PV326_001993, partial [Microctonus aethiopoides]